MLKKLMILKYGQEVCNSTKTSLMFMEIKHNYGCTKCAVL